MPTRAVPSPLRPPPPSERGQATPLVAVALLLAAVVLVGLAALGAGAIDAARARTAADAAALAGAADGRGAAAALAKVNGGRLDAYLADGAEVTVTVSVGRASARARARREGTWCRGDTGAQGAISYTEPPCPSTPG